MQHHLRSTALIPYYNAHEYIAETLQSMRNQARQCDEIVIINDGSTNVKSLQNLEELSRLSDISIIHQENGGIAAALNTGAKNATGDILFEVDADDILLPTYVQEYMNIFESDENIAGVTCGYQAFFSERDYSNEKNYHRKYMPKGYIVPELFFQNCLGGQNSAFRKKDLYDVGMWDEEFLAPQDWGIWLRMYQHQKKQFIIDDYLYLYRIHRKGLAQRIETTVSFDEELRKKMGLIKKGNEKYYPLETYLNEKKLFLKKTQPKPSFKYLKQISSFRKLTLLTEEAFFCLRREGLRNVFVRILNYITKGRGSI